MHETILVPLDGTALAERALPFAETIAVAAGARLLLLRVVAPLAYPNDRDLEKRRKAVADAEAYLAGLLPLPPRQVRVDTAVLFGGPTELVPSEVREHRAGLVVMATHGRTGLDAFVDGSVAGEVIHRAGVPVLLVPRSCTVNWSERRPARLLVPLDGSDLARAAIDPAAELAHLLGAELVLLRVVAPPAYAAVAASPRPVPLPTPGHDPGSDLGYLTSIAAGLREAGIVVSTSTVEDVDPVQAIAATAAEEAVDGIVLASHGRTGLGRLVLGSVATGVVGQATVPVLIVRPASLPARESY